MLWHLMAGKCNKDGDGIFATEHKLGGGVDAQ